MDEVGRNWAGNHAYRAAQLHRPATVAEAQEIVAGSARVRALGARHSFNAIADTPGDLLSLERLDRVVALNPERHAVTVEGGIRYGQLGPVLHAAGFALPNLASLPHITIAGACATATHGSGDRNGNLATAVSALDLIAPDGQIVHLSRERDGDRFRGAVVGLGALGIVARLTLDLVPAFQVAQTIYEHLPLDRLEADFDAITASGYSVSFFTDWRGGPINQVWVKRRVDAEAAPEPAGDFFGAAPAPVRRHPIVSLSADPCTEQLGIPGPWHERLTHFRPEHTPSNGVELQSEYFVPRRHALAAWRALGAIRERIVPVLQIGEVRTIAADDLWLSTTHGRDTVAFHFTWIMDEAAVGTLLPVLEAQLAPFDARPHWGKLFATAPARLAALYPRLPDFLALRRDLDPGGKFGSPFLDAALAGAG